MRAVTAPGPARLVNLDPAQLRPLLDEALGIYVAAMHYPPGTERQRGPMWMEHMLRADWHSVGAFDGARLVGITYGYRGGTGQWWHDEVRRGLTRVDPAAAARWLDDYFELTELHVHPDAQGLGTGRAMLRRLLSSVDIPRVLLSTPEGPTRALRLYHSVGFTDLLRHHRFAGDPRPFAVLGRDLPV
ncbi:MAG: GNAT family N-acetyltransferase [Actinomycetota bacterium]|nr:GNAT family N-acetyltransferase [Actinomycetota bacterium]